MPSFFRDCVKTLQILGSYGTYYRSDVSSQWGHDVWRSRQDKEEDHKSSYRHHDDDDDDDD